MIKKEKVELLAPAGNPASFYGAVNAGADAVYLAGNRFGARAYAENFSTEELVECIRYGHLLGKKIYLTVNTLMKEYELGELYDYIVPFYEAGLDAVIVQDFGVFRFLREHFPDMELHASTQMTLCSSFGAGLLKNMGATRIVPARELSLRELKLIKNNVNIELETFVHGAMCYCYSGQCLFSSILGGRSGNRGRCAQPCRLPYSVTTDGKRSKEAYFLSLKDMCTIEHIPDLIAAGIDSFKIEGRMKKPEYVAGVTALYRKYIDRYYELSDIYGEAAAKEKFCVEREDSKALSSLYIRSEIQNGYYFKHNGKEMITMSSPAYSGSDDMLLEKIRTQFLSGKKRLPVIMEAAFCEQEHAKLTLRFGECCVTVAGERVETADKQPITEENVRKQLGKLGDSSFFAQEICVRVSKNAFYPLKQINELRRSAVKQLEEAVFSAEKYEKRQGSIEPTKTAGKDNYSKSSLQDNGISVSVQTVAQLTTLLNRMKRYSEKQPSLVYVSGDLILEHEKEIVPICKNLAEFCSVFVALPYVLRDSDREYLERLYELMGDTDVFKGILIRSVDGLGFLKSREKQCKWHLDANVYTWNRKAPEQFGPDIDCFCLPYELKASEQRQLLGSGHRFEKTVYGRIPMMITANCVLRTSDRCKKDSAGECTLIDRYEKEFPVVRNCRHCMNIIYNSVPLSLHREFSKWCDFVRIRLDFTVESGEETERILNVFLSGAEPGEGQYTTGHEKRGVE